MQNKKLYRSSKDRIIAGIAGGIGEYLEVDPIVVRLVWLLLLLSGVGFLLYIFAWILIPNEPGNKKNASEEIRDKANEVAAEIHQGNAKGEWSIGFILGALLVLLGIGLFFQNIVGDIFWRGFWPVVLIIIGLLLVFKVREK